jgi:beta-glucosidase
VATLEPGERRQVTATIDRRPLSVWNAATRSWITPSGSVPIYVGSSSRDIRLAGRLRVK